MESDAGAEKYHRYHEPDPEMHEMGYGGYGTPEKPIYATTGPDTLWDWQHSSLSLACHTRVKKHQYIVTICTQQKNFVATPILVLPPLHNWGTFWQLDIKRRWRWWWWWCRQITTENAYAEKTWSHLNKFKQTAMTKDRLCKLNEHLGSWKSWSLLPCILLRGLSGGIVTVCEHDEKTRWGELLPGFTTPRS